MSPSAQMLSDNLLIFCSFITGPPTHSVVGETSNGRWRLSSVIVCNTSRRRICNITPQRQQATAGQ